MRSYSATAIAHPNIALIKYWGNKDPKLRIPSNGSISMTLGDLETKTRVTFSASLQKDELLLNGSPVLESELERVSQHLDLIRNMAKLDWKARIVSESNFPLSAGIASSASGFAALTLAAVHAAGLDLPQKELSRIARRGSGSATRSIYGGFVEFLAGDTDSDSYAVPIAPADHWDLVDLIAIVEKEPKSIGSSAGHSLAPTSPLQASRIADTPRRLQLCREAILTRNFAQLFSIVEQDSNLMHAVMMTSTPPLIYWAPNTIAIMKSVASWRKSNLKVCYTIDAGPNVHSICMRKDAQEVRKRLQHIPGVSSVLISKPGGPARIIAE